MIVRGLHSFGLPHESEVGAIAQRELRSRAEQQRRFLPPRIDLAHRQDPTKMARFRLV